MIIRHHKIINRVFSPQGQIKDFSYFDRVLRCVNMDKIEIFNENWSNIYQKCGDKYICIEKCPIPNSLHRKTIYYSPLKPSRNDWLIEKVTEVGINIIQPVIFQHSNVQAIKIERSKKIAIEATEQSMQYIVPEICNPISFSQMIQEIVDKKPVICSPGKNITPIAESPQGDCVIIGPEGGFSHQELEKLSHHGSMVSLGLSVLRVETAAIIAAWSLINNRNEPLLF